MKVSSLAALSVAFGLSFGGAALAALTPEAENYLRQAEDAAKRGDRAAAAQLFESAIIYSPKEIAIYDRLAQFYVGTGQSELAQKYFELALNIDPTDKAALQGSALLYLAAGDRAQAESREKILAESCGAACPETVTVQKALQGAPVSPQASR